MRRSRRGLQHLPSETFNNDTERSNAAATLTFEAMVSGVKQIDHVLLSTNGSGLFAVQGRLDDPAHSRIHMDRVQAAAQPVERSTEQLRHDVASQQQVQSQVQAQHQQVEQRGVALGLRP
ncbi:MAG: XVIPCD domain-containing protein [Luteimonas sp.]